MKLAKSGITPNAAAEIAEARIKGHIERHLRCCRVYLFGSRAKDNALRRSDFDIAVLPNEEFDSSAISVLQDAIEADDKIIYSVDLVNLAETSRKFRDSVLRNSIVWKSWI